jgi:hypothetical protein
MRSTLTAAYGFVIFAFAALGAPGCMPSSTTPMDGGPTDTGGGAVTYTKDIQPILAARCTPCHTTQGLGFHNIATSYADATKEVESVDSFGCWDGPNMDVPKKVGECALILIENGRMPQSAGCANTEPLMPALCPTADEKAKLMAWIAAGMPQ